MERPSESHRTEPFDTVTKGPEKCTNDLLVLFEKPDPLHGLETVSVWLRFHSSVPLISFRDAAATKPITKHLGTYED